MPAGLNVPSCVFHRHLLADLGLLFFGFVTIGLVALLASSLIFFDIGTELVHLDPSQVLAIRNGLLLFIDASALGVTLRLLCFRLGGEQSHTLLQMTKHSGIHVALCQKRLSQLFNLLFKLGLLFLVEAVFAGLLALNAPLEVLDVQILFNLSLVLLLLELGHLLGVFVLFPGEIVLQLLVLGGLLLDFLSKLALFISEAVVLFRIGLVLSDQSGKGGKAQVTLHLLLDHGSGLDESFLVVLHLFLVTLYSRLLLQLATQLLSAVLQVFGHSLHTSNQSG